MKVKSVSVQFESGNTFRLQDGQLYCADNDGFNIGELTTLNRIAEAAGLCPSPFSGFMDATTEKLAGAVDKITSHLGKGDEWKGDDAG